MNCAVKTEFFQCLEKQNEYFPNIGKYAETNRANWQWSMDYCRIYVDTPAGKIGIYQEEGSTNGTGTVTRSYIHKDHLGSVIATSDGTTNMTFYSYDAWGQQRDPDDWSPLADPITDNSELITDRGYTGHEMLSGLDLIHMNGRIYDPVIGRMISPDPLIQEPNNLQSFNRYSYVMNRPLSLSDPSGFVASGLEMVLGSARSGGGGGGDDGYAERIAAAPLSQFGFTPAQSENRDLELTESEEIYDADGYLEDIVITVTIIPGCGEERCLLGKGSSSSSDINNYGLNTGSSATLSKEDKTSTGVDANETELGKGDTKGKSVKGADQKKDPVEEAAKGGTGKDKFGNGADSNAQKQADGKKSVSNFDTDMTPGDKTDGYKGKWGYYDVDAEGNGGKLYDNKGKEITVDQLYTQMEKDGYKKGTPIYLYACGSGVKGGAASKLAVKAGATVVANTGIVTITRTERTLSIGGKSISWSSYDVSADGQWMEWSAK